MKIIRSSKCSIKFATNKKKMELSTILTEYGKEAKKLGEPERKEG